MPFIETNGYFTFGGVKSSDYGVWINGGGTYNAPARRYKEYSIPGRNGSLTIDEGAFADIEQAYPAFIAKNFSSNIQTFRNLLMSKVGYCRLTDSYHPDEFYRAKYMDGLEADVAPGGVAGSFTLTFKRDPRRFLTSGETETTITTSTGTISNPTEFPSLPLIRVTGYGTLTIGSDVITVSNTYAYVDIDSEIQDCYHGTDNANAQVAFQSGNFPKLKPGTNNIAVSGNISSVKITPRWYRV